MRRRNKLYLWLITLQCISVQFMHMSTSGAFLSFLIADGRMVLFSLGNAVCALSDRKYILYRKQIC